MSPHHAATASQAVSASPTSASEPEWVRHAIWWHVYPLGFVGAEPTVSPSDREPAGTQGLLSGGLARLHPWLDYAVELGVSGLLLGPIFASSSHGYDTVDHFRIDPRLGDEADFTALVRAARERGLRLILDGVFNHVGRAFPAFRQVLEQGPDAPRAGWFRLRWPTPFRPGVEPDYDDFEGHHQLVALQHAEPAVADYVARVLAYWLDRGISGWRLDAAYAVPPAFWAEVLPRVRAVHPEAYFFGEVIHGDYAGYRRASTLDAVTQYELWKAIWSSLNDRNFFELDWALQRHNGFLDSFVPQTFVGNHDVTRLASRLDDERHLAHALVLLCTCAGTPSIYAGDEQGFRGIKEHRPGGDDAIRPPFPATPDELAPFGWPVYRLHQQLIGLRRRHPWLHAARIRPLHLGNEFYVYESVCDGDRLVVGLNLGEKAVARQVAQIGQVLAGAAEVAPAGGHSSRVTLPPHGWAVLGSA